MPGSRSTTKKSKSCGVNCMSKQTSRKKTKSKQGSRIPPVSKKTVKIPRDDVYSPIGVPYPKTKREQYDVLRSEYPLPWYKTPDERGKLNPEDRAIVRTLRNQTESGKNLQERWEDLLESGETGLPENAVDSFGGGYKKKRKSIRKTKRGGGYKKRKSIRKTKRGGGYKKRKSIRKTKRGGGYIKYN